jgi:hypothetical protein
MLVRRTGEISDIAGAILYLAIGHDRTYLLA